MKIDYNSTLVKIIFLKDVIKSLVQYSSLPQRGHHSVSLVDTKISTSGVYRCQITEAQAPFHTEQQDKNLTIISKIFRILFDEIIFLFILVQPEGGSPRLKVSKSVMSIGDQALVECWSDRSKPAADLQFFINGNRVSMLNYDEITSYIFYSRFLGRKLMIWKYFLRVMVS